jgi:hypothetical protein
MKKTSYILLLLCLSLLSCNSVKPINGFGEKDEIGNKYDSINDITFNKDAGGNKLKIIGKWKLFDFKKYETDIFVSHCPIFINDENIILEFAKWDSTVLPLTNGNNLTKINSNALKYFRKKNTEILFSEYNPEKKYYLHKLKCAAKTKTNESYIVYILIGVKNKYVYEFALSNFKEENYLNLNQYLINLYNIN